MSNAPFLVNFLSPRKKEQCCYYLKQDFLNLLLLKQHRCSCFCNALLLFIYCWLCNFSWHWIIQPAAHEYWFPMTLKVCYHILLIVTINVSLYSEWAGKIWMIFIYYSYEIFLKEFSSKNIVEQYTLKFCFLLNSIACNHWNLRMKSLSILPHSLSSCLPYHCQQKGEQEWSLLGKKYLSLIQYVLRQIRESITSHHLAVIVHKTCWWSWMPLQEIGWDSPGGILDMICEGIPVAVDSLQTSDVD